MHACFLSTVHIILLFTGLKFRNSAARLLTRTERSEHIRSSFSFLYHLELILSSFFLYTKPSPVWDPAIVSNSLLKKTGDEAFVSYGPKLWNTLVDLGEAGSRNIF